MVSLRSAPSPTAHIGARVEEPEAVKPCRVADFAVGDEYASTPLVASLNMLALYHWQTHGANPLANAKQRERQPQGEKGAEGSRVGVAVLRELKGQL